jgi:D-glycero-alpha-D-manno-heptose-7-phosphate kinase
MKKEALTEILESKVIEASASCRIDCGGTLDIKTFYHALRNHGPATFNIALHLKTRVRLLPYHLNMIKISSTGFATEEYPAQEVPYTSPLGLMFAISFQHDLFLPSMNSFTHFPFISFDSWGTPQYARTRRSSSSK